MATKKKIYKYTFTVTVLSEDENYYPASLTSLNRGIDDGDCVGSYDRTKIEDCEGVEAVYQIKELGSSPDFFKMDEEGNEIED